MEFVDGKVRKQGSPPILAVERLKAQRGAEIGDQTGLFYVPRVVSFDPQEGVLEFEHLADLHNLLAVASRRDPRALDLAARAGVALAAVHQRLVLPEEAKVPLPAEWMDPHGQNVYIHGDYTGDNVCLHEPTGRLVIVDWSAAPFLKGEPTFGPRFFDVLWFIMSLFYNRLARRISRRASRELADEFLDAYIDAAGVGLTLPAWQHYRTLLAGLHGQVLRRAIGAIRGLAGIRHAAKYISAQFDLRTYRPRRFREKA